jgi:ATP synthase protein I
VIQSREPDIRRVAAWILVVQVAVTLAAAALSLAARGSRHGGSAIAGGSIGVIANLYMTLATLRRGGGAVLVLSRFLIGQFVKVGLTVAMFIIVARTGRAVWPPLIATYVATLVVFWAVPAIAAPRLPPRSRG